MFLRTADGNSVSTATKSATVTGSTIEGGQMSSKVKTQLTKINKYVFARKLFPLILFSVQVNRVDTNNRIKL